MKTLHYSASAPYAHDGDTERWVMVSFWTSTDGKVNIGQSQAVRERYVSSYCAELERSGWTRKPLLYAVAS